MRYYRNMFLFVSLLTMILLGALTFDLYPWLRGDLDWRWDYYPWQIESHFFIGLSSLAVYLLGAICLWWRKSSSVSFILIWSFLGCLFLPLTLQWLNVADPIGEILLRTTDPFLGGYQSIALEADNARVFLNTFTEDAPSWPPHPQRHPPGIVLIFILAENMLERTPRLVTWISKVFEQNRCDFWPLLYSNDAAFGTIILGFAPSILNAFTVFPMYLLAKRLFKPRPTYLILLAYPILPALVVWGGQWDLSLTLITILSTLLFHIGITNKKYFMLFVSGVCLSIGLFITHAMLVVVGFIGIYGIILLWLDQRLSFVIDNWVANLRDGMLTLLGIASLWLTYWIFIGDSYLDIYRVNTLPHFEMGTNYLSRLFYNPYDFFLFTGFIIAGLCGMVIIRIAGYAYQRRAIQQHHGVILATILTMIILVVSGVSRAEVGRVWIFMMPLVLMAACTFLADIDLIHQKYWGSIVLFLLAGQTVIVQTNLMERHPFPHQFDQPFIMIPQNENVGEHFRFKGWALNEGTFEPGETIKLTLFWQSLSRSDRSFTRFVHLYSDQSGLVAQSDGIPKDGRYPTICWVADEYILEEISLFLSNEIDTGTYQLQIGMYDPDADFRRLPTTGPNAETSNILLSKSIIIQD